MWIPDPRFEEPSLLIPGKQPVGPMQANGQYASRWLLPSDKPLINPAPGINIDSSAISLPSRADHYEGKACVRMTNESFLPLNDSPFFNDARDEFWFLVDFTIIAASGSLEPFFGFGGTEGSSIERRVGQNRMEFVVNGIRDTSIPVGSTFNGDRIVAFVQSSTSKAHFALFNVNSNYFSQGVISTSDPGKGASTNTLRIGGVTLDTAFYFGMWGHGYVTEAQAASLVRDPYQLLIPA